MRIATLTILLLLLYQQHEVSPRNTLAASPPVNYQPLLKSIVVSKTANSSPDTADLRNSHWYAEAINNIERKEYEINYNESTHSYSSPNRQQGMRAFFTAASFGLQPRDEAETWNLELQLKGIGSGNQLAFAPAEHPAIEQTGNTIRFHHGNQFSVEYINNPEGVRQNFIIHKKPTDESSRLKVQLVAKDDWYINKVHDKELHFAKAENNQLSKKITYNSLKAWDANNKELDAAFVVNTATASFEIDVNVTDAVYPVWIDPLSTSPAWIGEGNQTNAAFGLSVYSAGDVNGDGYSDVIIGVPNYDGGNTFEGRAYVYHGSATGLSGTAAWVTESNQANAVYGNCAGTAGDVNGDGYSDVIVGARLYDAGQMDEGRAFVYHGSAAGLSLTAAWTGESNQLGANFGESVSTAGDVNGDGYSDVIISAPSYNGGSLGEGRAYVYLGSASGLVPTPAWTAESDQDLAEFGGNSGGTGVGASSAGDVNGDGYSDIIVGAPSYHNGESDEGMAFVYHGSSGGPALTPSWTAEINFVDASFGSSVASAGDVNGDGYSDVIIGAYTYNNGGTPVEGAAFVYPGSASGLSGSPIWSVEGNQTFAAFGATVAAAGDVNGDGYSDIIVGAGGFANGQTDEGKIFVYHGSATGLPVTANWSFESNLTHTYLGNIVASAGDVNGDGYSDVIAGAPFYDNGNSNEGGAFVFHGSPDGISTLSTASLEGNQSSVNFGFSVASAGDVNSDGYSDVIIGAPFYTNGQTGEGAAFVFHGSGTGITSTIQALLECNVANAFFGRTVASAGDVNGDGFGDVIVASDQYNSGDGAAFVYHGSITGINTTAQAILQQPLTNAWGNVCASSAGDVNADGYSDVIVGGDMFTNGQTQEGGAFIFHGGPTGINTTFQTQLESNQVAPRFGTAVASAGDVNGDGYGDVIVGANAYNNGQTLEGVAFVYHGGLTGITSTIQTLLEINQMQARFGCAVASAGDVNGDGFCDVIVGANSFSNGQSLEGGAFIFHGSISGITTTIQAQLESNQSLSQLGSTVSSAGDVNGDGYSDVIAGSHWFVNGQSNEGAAFVYHGSASGVSTTIRAQLEANQASANMGFSVASAGDVNGDGYSDVIVSAHNYSNGNAGEGAAFIYHGNNPGGLRNNLRLYNQDMVTPIQQSSLGPALFAVGLYSKSSLGRQKGKLVWETVPDGQPFSGNPITNSTAFLTQQVAFSDLSLLGVELKNQVAKEFNTKATYVRARVKYDLATAITGQVYGPWRYPESFLRGNRTLSAVALPVKFISFTAIKQNENALLKWVTTNEISGIQYEVQHSTNGIHFTTLTTIAGINSTNLNAYQWLHTSPAKGKNYYRIRVIENNKETFTSIRQLYFGEEVIVTIYPNPVKSGGVVTIDIINSTTTGITFVELYGINGQKHASYTVRPGSNQTKITLPHIHAGSYILKFVNNSRILYSGSLIVVK